MSVHYIWLFRYNVDFTPAQLAVDQLVDDETRHQAAHRQLDDSMSVSNAGGQAQPDIERELLASGQTSTTAAHSTQPLPSPMPVPEPEPEMEPEEDEQERTNSATSARMAAADLSAAMVRATLAVHMICISRCVIGNLRETRIVLTAG